MDCWQYNCWKSKVTFSKWMLISIMNADCVTLFLFQLTCILHKYKRTSESCQILDNDIAINHVKAYAWISYKFVLTQVAITRKFSNHIEIWLLWMPFLAPTDCEFDCKISVASFRPPFDSMSTPNVYVDHTIVWKSKVIFSKCMLISTTNADRVAPFMPQLTYIPHNYGGTSESFWLWKLTIQFLEKVQSQTQLRNHV